MEQLSYQTEESYGIMANLRNMSIEEQFRLTADEKDFFNYFEVFVNNFTNSQDTFFKERYYSRMDFVELLQMKPFMIDDTKCISVELRQEFRELKYKDLVRQSLYPGLIFKMGINNTTAYYNVILQFGVTENDPLMAYMHTAQLSADNTEVTFTYDAYESKLLEYPYQTDCRNYSKDNFISQGDCHEKCIKHVAFESPDSLNMMPVFVSIQRNETSLSGKPVTLAPVSTFAVEKARTDNYIRLLKTQIQDVLSFCDKKCSQRECESKILIPRLLSMEADRFYSYLTFSVPSNPSIAVVCQPKYSFIEFITGLFATLGFWLGVSVFGSVFDVKTAEKVLVEKKAEIKRKKDNTSNKFSLDNERNDSNAEERHEGVKLRRSSKESVSQTTAKMEIYSFLWFAACFGANIYHIYNLINEYSKYEVLTDVQNVYPDVIDVPMTVYCFRGWRIIRFLDITKEELAQLLRREPDEYSNETSWIPYDFDNDTLEGRRELYETTGQALSWKKTLGIMANLRNNSIDEQFRLTADVKDIFNSLEVYVNNFTTDNRKYVKERYLTTSSETFGQLIQSKQFMRDDSKCFSVKLKDQFRKLKFKDVVRQSSFPRLIFQLEINETIASYAELFHLGVTDNDPSTASMHSLLLNAYKTATTFTYDSYESKLLEYPYQTDCRNYSKDNFISQGDCHEKCVKHVAFESPDSLNMMPVFVSIQRNETSPSGKPITLASASTYAKQVHMGDNYNRLHKAKTEEILSFCDTKCSQRECDSKKYIPRLLSMDIYRSYSYLTFSVPSNPYIVVVCQPKYSFIEFITGLFSTLGFWLGVSVFGSVFDVKTAEKVLVEKKAEIKRKKANNSIKFFSDNERSDSDTDERHEGVKLRRYST